MRRIAKEVCFSRCSRRLRFVRWRLSFIAVCFLATLVTFCIFGRLLSAMQRPEDSNFPRNQSLQCSYLFDWDFYFRNSPDVKQANVLPEKHFLESGWKEHRMFGFYRSGAVGGHRMRLEVPDCSPSFPPKALRFGGKEESFYWEFMDEPPLARLLIAISEPQRLNVILPGWDFEHFFGGLISIAQFSIAMSNQGFQVRWISLAPSPSDLFTREELFARFANLKGLESLPSDIEFSPSQPRDLKCSPNDIFMATLYTTAEIAHAYQKQMSNGKFLYFVQDYEPIFYAHSSAHARAMTSYTLPHFALFGTHFLESYFRKYRVGVFGHPSWEAGYLTYQNGISPASEVLATDFARLPQAPRSLLVYLRIEEAHARNMWQLAVAGLSSAIRRGVINPSEWVFHGIGSVTTTGHDICGLGGSPGVCLRLLPQKSQKEYEHMLGSYDIGLALMLSPHPSLVPLDFAAAGMITITNTYDTKTEERLQEISGNIIACAPSREEVATAIGRAVIRSRDTLSRAQNAKLNWTNSWTSEQAFGISFGNHLRSAYARQPPTVAFIVRTYIRHLDKDEVNGLHGLLNSLSALRNPHWRAYIYVSDPSQAQVACERIDALVDSLADARIIWKRTVAKEPFEYLSNGFRFMDDFAQQVTADQDEWLVFTNGDNEYLPSALDHLCPLYDAIALNFYSRYASSGSVLNTGSVGGADLGSVLVRRRKWLSERRRFSDMPSTISQDGALFQLIQNEGWHFRYFDSSLVQFSHNPNPINCAKMGHIWLASPRFDEQVCLTNERAALHVRHGELEFSSSCPVPSSRCLRYVARKLAQKQAEEQKRDEEFMKEVCKRTKAERKFGMPVGFPERRWAECPGLFANAEDEAIVRRNLIASVRS